MRATIAENLVYSFRLRKCKLYKNDNDSEKRLNNITSPCESAALLSVVAKGMNPPPQNSKKWILDNISEEKKNMDTVKPN